MRLWNPDDPYGIAVARRVLLWFALAVVIIGVQRLATGRDGFEFAMWLGVTMAALALVLEPVMALFTTRRGDERS